MNNCQTCGRYRPLFAEPDRTMVCYDCFTDRNGAPPYRAQTYERTIAQHPRSGMWAFPFVHPYVEDPRRTARFLAQAAKKASDASAAKRTEEA